MKINKKALAIALTFGAVFGAVTQQSNASIYARSYLEIDNLQLGVLDFSSGSPVAAGADITSYVNSITNTSALNGAVGISGATCTLTGSTACGSGNPVLDTGPSQLGESWANNDFGFKGPGANEYSRSDAVVWESAITQIRDGVDPATAKTHTEQIAEAELQTGQTAGSTSVIQSTTGITFTFTIDESSEANGFFVNFDAIFDQLVSIDDDFSTAASAQSELNLSVTLSRDNSDDVLQWAPGGLFGLDCISSFGVCVTTNSGDLNNLMGVTSNPSSASNAGGGLFTMFADGLQSGNWTLVLNATLKTLLTRVPVPGTLAIFGLGLAAMGMMGRRRKLKSA